MAHNMIEVRGLSTASAPRCRYRFRDVAAMEWIKLVTLRSTWWTLAITLAGAVAMAVVIGLNTKNAAADLTNNALAGMVHGLLLTGVLGVLIMTSEYTSGMIRATLAAAPRRPLVLAAKAAVFGGVTLVLGEAAAFTAFLAGGAALRHGITAPALTQPGVLRAVVLSGASAYLPISIIANSLGTTKPETCGGSAGSCPHLLSAWAGLGVLCLYAAALLAVGGWLLSGRDA